MRGLFGFCSGFAKTTTERFSITLADSIPVFRAVFFLWFALCLFRRAYSTLRPVASRWLPKSVNGEEIKLHNAWLWWPLLISILLASGLMSYFYSWVD